MASNFIGRFYTVNGGQVRFFAESDFSSGTLYGVDPVTASQSVIFEGSYADAVARLSSDMLAAASAPQPVMAAPAAHAPDEEDEGISVADMVSQAED